MDTDQHDENVLPDRIYDIAVSPARLEQLIDSWIGRLRGGASAADFQLFEEPGLLRHIQRAELVLQELIALRADESDSARDWAESARVAAIVVNRSGIVLAANTTAQQTLLLLPGQMLSALPVDPADLAVLTEIIERLDSALDTGVRLLRLRRRGETMPILVRIVEAVGEDAQQIGIMTSLISWPGKLSGQLMKTFQLTLSEAEVLKDMTLGYSVKEIAGRRNRSEPTIRSQVRGLLEKTGTRSQMELVRITLGLLDVVEQRSPITPMRGPPGVSPLANVYHTLVLADQRKFDYLAIGDPRGRPFLMLPTDAGFTRLPPKAEAWLANNCMRMVVPVRAGYGHSSPLPKRRNAFEVAVADMLELCDHLGIDRCPILSFCDDFHLAVAAACAAPARVSAIVGVGPTMPATEPKHFKRMPKWTRFIFANARYAPKTLPFLAKAFFLYMRRLGPRRFMKTVMATSPADLKLLEDDELLAALLRGSEISVGPRFTAHIAWAAGAVANYGADWSGKLAACPVPVTLYAGEQDPFAPIETTREYVTTNPGITLHEFGEYGQLLYPLWPLFLGEMERRLGK